MVVTNRGSWGTQMKWSWTSTKQAWNQARPCWNGLQSFPRTGHNLHPISFSNFTAIIDTWKPWKYGWILVCVPTWCCRMLETRFCRQLLSERDALELHLKVATLNILKPDSDHLLHLAIDDGDGAIPGDPDAIFCHPFVKLCSICDSRSLIGSSSSNQWLDVDFSLSHPVIGGERVLVIDLLSGGFKKILLPKPDCWQRYVCPLKKSKNYLLV